MAKLKQHLAAFKAWEALDALRDEQTLSELAVKHGIHPTLVTKWKKTAIEGMSEIFDGNISTSKSDHQELRRVHFSGRFFCGNFDQHRTDILRADRKAFFALFLSYLSIYC